MSAADLADLLRPILLRALDRCDSTSNSHHYLAGEALVEIEEALAPTFGASAYLLEALEAMMPTNLGSLPETMPDTATLTLTVTCGQLRAARAAIAKARGQ